MQHTKWEFHGVIEKTLLAYLISRFTNPRVGQKWSRLSEQIFRVRIVALLSN
jgi:hypothetical protein